MPQNSETAEQRPRWGLAIFCLTQLLLTYGALWWLVGYGVRHETLSEMFDHADAGILHWLLTAFRGVSPMIGVGDAQLALAGVLLGWRIFRWSVRWPLALVLLSSGWAIHFVAIVGLPYPFVSGEEYFIAPLQVIALAAALRLWATRSGESAKYLEPHLEQSHRLRLSDLFGWMLAAALCLTIGKQALRLTDDLGFPNPGDAFDLMIRHDPAMVLWRMPLLLTVIAAFAIAWMLTSRAILVGPRLTVAGQQRVLMVFGCLFVGEVVFGFVPLLFDVTWTFVPVSIELACGFARRLFHGTSESSLVIKWGFNLVALFATQAFVFVSSLLLLRWSGVRVVPAIETSARPRDGGS